jgi:hypothetical protein
MKNRNFQTIRRFGLILRRMIVTLIIIWPGFGGLYAQGSNGSDNKSIINTLQIIGLVGSLATIILGVIAIWLSLYFYRRSNELSNAVSSKLTTIEVSSKVTETTSTSILQPVISTIMSIFRQSTISGFDYLRSEYMVKIASGVNNLATATTDAEKKKAKDSILKELNAMFGTFKDKIDEISISPSTSALSGVIEPFDSYFGVPKVKWVNFIQRIDKLEEEMSFLSVKWLRERVFKNESDFLEILQVAIHSGILEKYYVDNPKNPKFPTLACKLDRSNEFVKQIISKG